MRDSLCMDNAQIHPTGSNTDVNLDNACVCVGASLDDWINC